MKVDGSIHSLIQGVSQQPAKIRLMGQCSVQENCSSNPVDGLTRRPPTDYISALSELNTDAQFYDFTLNGIDFILVIYAATVKVFDILGNEYQVTLGTGASDYLIGSPLSFTTIDKDTYIANPNIVVKMKTDTKEYSPQSSIIHLVGGQYGRTYKVTVKWGVSSSSFQYIAPNGAASSDTPKVATTYIASHLETAFNANGTLTPLFQITRADDVLLIESTDEDSADFTISVDDGDGGSRMFVTNNTVIDVGNLPRYAPQGYFASVTGAGTADVDDYYLEFEITESTESIGDGFGKQGIWKETVQKDIQYLLDTSTMPFILSYDEDTQEFTIAAGDWKGRQVGDETTNESPSFVDSTITSLAHFQGRLVALTGENRVMSRTNKPLDFWRETATALTDTDGIDDSSTTKSAKLNYALPFNRDLILFAEKAQFVTFGRNALTPQNSSLVLTTEFESNSNVRPVVAGKNIFYATRSGKFTGIREFFNDSNLDINDARPITQHIIKYIEGQCTRLSSSTTFDLLLVSTDADSKVLYAYEYIWIGQDKKQSSWSKWIFNNPILYTFFREDIVYILTLRNNQLSLEKMDLGVANTDGLIYPIMLDSRVSVQNVVTSFTNPLNITTGIIVVQGAGCPNPGLIAEIASLTSGTIVLEDSMLNGTVHVGEQYLSRYKPTLPFVKDRDGIAIGTGHLIVSKFLVNYVKTGYFGYSIISPFADTYNDYFSGKILNSPEDLIGEQSIVSGQYIVPFREPVDISELEINSETHLPFTITDIEWKGQYIKKGQRISSGG